MKVGLLHEYGSSAFVCLVPILLKNSVSVVFRVADIKDAGPDLAR